MGTPELALARQRASWHTDCFVCRSVAEGGLGLRLKAAGRGEVEGRWQPDEQWCSFSGVVHGGILASVLDGAMMQAVFSTGLSGRTGELRVRYRREVHAGEAVAVKGWVVEEFHRLRRLRARLVQTNRLCVEAEGRFLTGDERALREEGEAI